MPYAFVRETYIFTYPCHHSFDACMKSQANLLKLYPKEVKKAIDRYTLMCNCFFGTSKLSSKEIEKLNVSVRKLHWTYSSLCQQAGNQKGTFKLLINGGVVYHGGYERDTEISLRWTGFMDIRHVEDVADSACIQ